MLERSLEPDSDCLDVGAHRGAVLAQIVRLAALLGRTASVKDSVERLRQVALRTAEGWAVPYQPESPSAHENAWATMFAAQALALVEGCPVLEWWELI
jgi:hypothetical protein